jgi:hypothetical protein
MSAALRRPDAHDVASALTNRICELCATLLPAGRLRGGYWKAGSVANEPGGSLYVHLSGARAGRWQDAATGEFGDALDLVAACVCRGDKRTAYAWACAWLGHDAVPQTQRAPTRANAATVDLGDAHRRRAALQLYLEAQASLAGTPAWDYLAHRGIELAGLGQQPRALRFHPMLPHRPSGRAFPALIAAICNADGALIAIHRTWLEQDERAAWIKARVVDSKMSLGNFSSGSIRLWRGTTSKPLRDADPDETVVIGEGIETCLSIALACPELRVLAAVSLGNMGAIALPSQLRSVILAADNDTSAHAQLAFRRVVERHLDAGRDVRIARAAWGKDFNDTYRA